MSALSGQAGDYLRLRRALGHNLDQAHRLLPDFVAYLDAIGAETVTVEAALVWAQRPDADPATSVRARRMTVARGFARHMTGVDPNTEIPPLGLVRFRQRRRPPFIYPAADITALMSAARRTIPTPLRAATVETIIGLLAATGMRVGEATGFQRGDLDTAEGVITLRHSKFGNYAEGAVMPSPVTGLVVCGNSAQDYSA
jgi:integrase